MNTELQNKVWSILPKEFKEEVKRLWQSADKEQQLPHDAFLRGEYSMLVSLFGRHNLTSDEEEEEMLTISRKEVQEMYSAFEEFKDKDNTCFNLETLFGSKCLLDELNEDNFVKSEPKPAEPKFKIGDELVWDKRILVKIDEVFADGKYLVFSRIGNRYMVKESDLEPYTEPTQQPTTDCSNLDKQASTCTNVCTIQSAPNPNPETVRNLRKSDEDSESEALLNQIPDTAKMVDNIIKDDFRDHNRLHIASIAMAGILAAPLDNVGFITNKCVDDVAEYALRCADALLELTANTTKGGSK